MLTVALQLNKVKIKKKNSLTPVVFLCQPRAVLCEIKIGIFLYRCICTDVEYS